jgi:hypothetical protein
MFSDAASGYANRMNTPVRDVTSVAAQLVTQAHVAGADAQELWDALWTLDDDWHPEPVPFGGDPAVPESFTIL